MRTYREVRERRPQTDSGFSGPITGAFDSRPWWTDGRKRVTVCSKSVMGRCMPSGRGPLKQLRRICLVLPEVTEKIAWGEPTFRVRGKMFALCRGESHPGLLELWSKAGSACASMLGSTGPWSQISCTRRSG